MIIWKGWGILALLIPLVCSLLAGWAFDTLYGASCNYSAQAGHCSDCA